MVATMSIYYDTGGADTNPATQTDVDALGPPQIRFKLADNPTIDTADKCVIPAAGTAYSMWKQIYLHVDNADGNTMNNLKTYADGANSFGVGVDLMVGNEFPEHNSGSDAGYEVATKTGDSGDEMVAAHASLTGSATVFGYTSAAPLAGPSISEAGAALDNANEESDYLVFQMNIANTAAPGELPVDETLTIQYDEF